MLKNIIKYLFICFSLFLLGGCASTGMIKANAEKTTLVKKFNNPPEWKSGLYLYRYTPLNFGAAIVRSTHLDNFLIARLKHKEFVYLDVNPGEHTIPTESEFGLNELKLLFKAGKKYFVRQYIKMGVFVGGSNLVQMDEAKAKKDLKEDNYKLMEFKK